MDILPVDAIRQCMTAPLEATCPASPASAPDPAVVARFQELMNEPVPVNQANPADKPEMAIPFGAQLMEQLHAQQEEHAIHMRNIHGIISNSVNGSLTQADLLRLQVEVQNLSIQQNVVSKVIESASSAIQTLIKNN